MLQSLIALLKEGGARLEPDEATPPAAAEPAPAAVAADVEKDNACDDEAAVAAAVAAVAAEAEAPVPEEGTSKRSAEAEGSSPLVRTTLCTVMHPLPSLRDRVAPRQGGEAEHASQR